MSHNHVTIAQLGCGYWGPNLLRNFSALPDCRVKYVVELASDRRTFVERTYPKTEVVAAPDVVLADPDVDAVIVATPAGSHFALTKKVLQAGKHAFVEKPIAMSSAEADELAALAAAKGRTLMVGHTFLYNAAVEYLKALVQRGELGTIYYVYAQRLNLGVIRADVNAMWNLAPHDVSIINYVLGDAPHSVSATGTAYIQDGVEDVVFMNLRYPDKVQASVHVSWLDPNKVRRITVVGSRKMVVYDDGADAKIAVYDKGIDRHTPEKPFDEVSPVKMIHRSGDVWLPKIDFIEPIKIEAQHFLECVRTGAVPKTGPANARDVVAVLEAAERSLKENSVVVEIARAGSPCIL